MSAVRVVVIARKSASWFLTLLLLASASAGKTNRVTIGTLTYLGTEGVVSAFRVMLDPSAVTSQSLSFASATLVVDGTTQASGPITTPVTLLYLGSTVNGPLASCAGGCVSIAVQLVSATGEPLSVTLVDGKEFTTFAVTTAELRRLPGQKFIQPQQSVPIVLKRDASGSDRR
jgi:hypothetical protein